VAAAAERFLRERLPAAWVTAIDQGDPAALAAARQQFDTAGWWAPLAEAGYVTPSWPWEYGGHATAPEFQAADVLEATAPGLAS